MKMDANHINRGEAIIVIEAQDHQVSCDIEKAYEGIVQIEKCRHNCAEKYIF